MVAGSAGTNAQSLEDFVKQKGVATLDDMEPASRSVQKMDPSLLHQFTKHKGLASFDDEEEEELLLPQGHHELVVHIEHCTAQRPSRTGSLRGSSQKYEDHTTQLKEVLQPLCGDGSLRIAVNQQELSASADGSRRPRSRPASAGSGSGSRIAVPAPLQPAWPEQATRTGPPGWPRIGAFEVSLVLRNLQSNVNQPPEPVYSKLQTGRWPCHSKLKTHFSSVLHEQLKQDEKDFAAFEMKQAVFRQETGAADPT